MKKQLPLFLNILTYTAFIISVFLAVSVIQMSQQRQHLSQDLAELSHIKYGLLNADLWKEKAAVLIRKKLEEFELQAEQRAELKDAVEYALGQMINELDSFMLKDQAKDDWGSKIKTFLHENALKPIDLRSKIPAIAERTLQEFEKEEVQHALKDYLGKQIEQLIQETDSTVDLSAKTYILEQYGFKDAKEAHISLSSRILSLQSRIWQYALWLLIPVFIGFLAWWGSTQHSWSHYIALGLLSMTLLSAGILIPMLDIDARIIELYFKLLGEEIRFEDQILFFQSKSILDVIYLLLFKGDYSTLIVGVLILTFSVIFPTAKLISAIFAFKHLRLLHKNPIINFLVLKSGKWSMADVMVVAIFMAYIGFKGILKGQLGQLESTETVEILTTHQYTSLQPGILLFSAFCICSLLLTVIMQKRLNQLNQN
jgi:hypothetical protein